MKKLSLLVAIVALAFSQAVPAQWNWNTSAVGSGGTFSGTLKGPVTADCSAPSYSFTGDSNTGITSTAADALAWCAGGTSWLNYASGIFSFNNGASLVLTGGTASGEGNIQFGATPNAVFDNNLLYLDATDKTIGIIGGSTPSFLPANGPYLGMRGITYTTFANQRGVLFMSAGTPAAPGATEGEIRLNTDSVQRLVVRQLGSVDLSPNTALPAGGSTTLRLLFSSTAGFGIYVGSGVPTVSAAQGSLYLRSDGSSTSTRLYVNTDGGTTWTSITTGS